MSQAVVIAAANTKGGSGKTTTILILAGEYAAQGYRVHIIDADPSKRILRWIGAKNAPESITASAADAKTMRAEIEKGREAADVVLIDVEGSANAALTFAVAYANAVIIPAKISPADVEDGLATMQMVNDMANASRRVIPCGILWSEVPPAIRTREMINLEAQIAEAQIPVITRIFQRSAFAALYSFGTTLDELPAGEVAGVDKAKADAIRLTDALELMMNPTSDKASSAEVAA